MAMFGQFTKRAQQAIELARQAAVKENQPFVGTVHILLGLLLAGGNYPEEILNKVSIPYLQQVIHGLHTNLELPQTPVKQLAMTPNARRLLELSVRESRLLGQAFVGPELLLLALVKPPRPFAATTVLQRCGVDLSAAAAYLKAAATGQRLDPAASGAGEAAKPEDDAKENTQKGTPSSQNQPPVPPMRTNQPVVPPASPAGQRPQGKRAPSVLEQYGRDLTESARQGLLDPVIGREMEIQRIVQILIRRTKNNPVLIGEPGVGKSSVVEGLAQRIVTGAVPEMLLGKRVISLDLSGMVAGTKYRGEFEERLKNAMAEIRRAGDVLLFVDEVHTLVGAGSAEGSMDAANILKPAMARGEVQCIGATTLDEYRKHIEKDAALERRFQPVNVGEPTAEETLAILHGLRERYESHHSVRITDEALESAVQLAGRYIPDRFQPDK
ncbi:MAG: ATP-dependent Clp protease ATP-binding subunit, partial [Clostridia bacterium]|nr:ATP-dependent Clp protease ATP-binding subunit [Clostridia bacterium]